MFSTRDIPEPKSYVHAKPRLLKFDIKFQKNRKISRFERDDRSYCAQIPRHLHNNNAVKRDLISITDASKSSLQQCSQPIITNAEL